MLDSLYRGEAPFASHALYTQMLDDTIPEQRSMGINAGLAWGDAADLVAVYQDLGISAGMKMGIERHQANGTRIEYRSLPEWTTGQK